MTEGLLGSSLIPLSLGWLAPPPLHSSVSQRQAKMPDPGVSEMSLGSHREEPLSGFDTGPSRIDGEKHSLGERMMK